MKNISILSILLLATTSSAFADSIFISPASKNVSVGQTFSVDIDIDNIPDLFDYQFSLSYNSQVLAANSMTEGALFATTNDSFFSPGTIDNSTGTITLAFDTLFGQRPGVAGPGTLAVAQFTAIAPGTSAIDFSPVGDLILEDSNENVLTVAAGSGNVVVTAAMPTPEPGAGALSSIGLLVICIAAACARIGSYRRRPQASLPSR